MCRDSGEGWHDEYKSWNHQWYYIQRFPALGLPYVFNEVHWPWLAARLWLRNSLLPNDSHSLKTQVKECFTVKLIQVKGAQLIVYLCSTGWQQLITCLLRINDLFICSTSFHHHHHCMVMAAVDGRISLRSRISAKKSTLITVLS